MMLKIKRYLSAYNEYCGVNEEATNTNMKLIIGNRISGTGNREAGTVPNLSKRLGYFKTVKSETGNWEPGSSSLSLILVYTTHCFKSANRE